jgi:4-hydroxythreonine-4-phosphate dehydrogenase
MGDPAGIGAEVIVKALQLLKTPAEVITFGAHSPMLAAASAAGITPTWTRQAPSEPITFTRQPRCLLIDDELAGAHGPYAPDSQLGGQLSFGWVMRTIECVKAGAHAAVTGPISKLAWSLAGQAQFPGHTELFAQEFGSERYAMFFHAPPTDTAPGMNVILATVHIPLMHVARHLSVSRVIDTIELANETLKKLGIPDPSIAVCGLNPHAGEGGLLGVEDQTVIEPAVKHCAHNGIRVTGPHPADTIFSQALTTQQHRAKYDVVVAMYHDQGLIALKTLAWDRAVNVTVGLRATRTSPDHGTAFNIAGQNRANPGSMLAALNLALQL